MEKAIYELEIDPELRDFIPPLSENELATLTESLIEDGCNEPLTVWNRVIVDGHNRYKICRENGIPFAYEEKSFDSKDKAKLWMAKKQLGRRNLKPFQRCELVYPLEKEISEEVERNRRAAISKFRTDGETTPNLEGSEKTAICLANYADVSTSTWFMAKAVIENADPDSLSELRSGKAAISTVYKKLKKKDHPAPVEDKEETETPNEESPKPVSYIDHPMEDPVTMHEPERKPMPYQFVKEQVEFAVRNMIADMKIGLYGLRNEDFDRKRELKNILKDGYKQAAQIIDEMEKMS